VSAHEDIRSVVRDAVVLTLAAATVGLVVNALRPRGLPLVAKGDFEILVPCPEPSGTAELLNADDPKLQDPTTFLIDARSSSEYQTWHWPNAISIPFDWLAEGEQIDRDARAISRKVAASGKHAVVVYGDGADPDSGQQWAVLLNASGIRNVSYVKGGSVELRRRQP
jgi:rhodanese-related sulfurtransferase